MVHLGLAVHRWSQREQNLLMTECLAPLARDLSRKWPDFRFWWDRFDQRGPHVFSLWTVDDEHRVEMEQELTGRLDAHLADRGDLDQVSGESVRVRHQSCGGKVFCRAHEGSGLAERDSYHLFDHPPSGYPFEHTARMCEQGGGRRRQAEIWRLVHDLCLWTTSHLSGRPARPPLGPAIRWLAALDHELHRQRPQAAGDYWLYHASSLLGAFPGRLEEDRAGVIAELPAMVGEKNWRTFTRFWEAAEGAPPPWSRLPALVEMAVGDPPLHPWSLLREIVHTALKQMCLYVGSEIPLVLYAWLRSLRGEREGGLAEGTYKPRRASQPGEVR